MSTPINDIDTNYQHKMVNHGYPHDLETGIVDMNATYIQRNDTFADSDKWQQMTLETVGLDFDENENTDSFIRIKIGKRNGGEVDIEKFWSVNGLEDLARLFNDFERRRGSSIHYKVIKEVTHPDGTLHTGTFE